MYLYSLSLKHISYQYGDLIQSAKFFKMPLEVKVCLHPVVNFRVVTNKNRFVLQTRLAWEDPRSNRGYVAQGRERVTQSSDAAEIAAMREKAPDFKETMEIGRDWDATWKNQWPREEECPGFKNTMLSFFQVSRMN